MRLGRHPAPRAGATLAARLFARPDCHLCEWAQADLERLQASVPHTLELVDITLDPELLRRFGERIPVLEIGGREIDAPLPYAVLERALPRRRRADAVPDRHPTVQRRPRRPARLADAAETPAGRPRRCPEAPEPRGV